jgi:glycosyltransferase involved in cell wall biosynthesis
MTPQPACRPPAEPVRLQKADVSVLVLTRNQPDALARALASVQRQARADLCATVIDNGSTAQVLSAYDPLWDRLDDRFALSALPAPDLNPTLPSRLFNRAARDSSAEFTAFLLDCDEWIADDHLAFAVECLRAEHADFFFSDGPPARERGARSRTARSIVGLETDNGVHALRPSACPPALWEAVPISTLVVRTDALLAVGGFWERLRFGEEFDLIARMADRSKIVLFRPTFVAKRRLPFPTDLPERDDPFERAFQQMRAAQHVRLECRLPSIRAAARRLEATALKSLSERLLLRANPSEARRFARQALACLPGLSMARHLAATVGRSASQHCPPETPPLGPTNSFACQPAAPQGTVPRVSVVMATRNRPALAAQAIQTVMAQSFSDFELILADDGSTRETWARYEDLQAQWGPRLVIDRRPAPDLPGSGGSAARNRGLRRARGEFIALLDDDDLWIAGDHLQQAVASLDSARADFYFGNIQYFKGHDPGSEANRGQPTFYTAESRLSAAGRVPGDRPIHSLHLDDLAWLLKFYVIHPDSVVVRRSLVDRTGGFWEQSTCFEDYEWTVRLLDCAQGILYRDECVAGYRLNEGECIRTDHTFRDRKMQHVIIRRHTRSICRSSQIVNCARAREGWELRELAREARALRLGTESLWYSWQGFCTYPTLKAAWEVLSGLVRPGNWIAAPSAPPPS